MKLELDFDILQRVEALDRATRRRLNRYAAEYIGLVSIGRRHDHQHPESLARSAKLDAIKTLQESGFSPREAVAAFHHIFGQLEGSKPWE